MGGDGAFAEDHPGVAAAAEVDDGGCHGARGGAAIDDERNLVAKLVADASGVGAFGQAVEVGRGGGDGQAELLDDGAADGAFGHAQGDVAGVGGDAQGEFAAGLHDDREGAWPEAFGEKVEGGADGGREFVGLHDIADEQRERLVAGAGFEVVDAIDGAEIYGIDGEAVEGVSRQGGHFAGVEAINDAGDQCVFGFVGVDAKKFCVQDACPTIAYSTRAAVRGYTESADATS